MTYLLRSHRKTRSSCPRVSLYLMNSNSLSAFEELIAQFSAPAGTSVPHHVGTTPGSLPDPSGPSSTQRPPSINESSLLRLLSEQAASSGTVKKRTTTKSLARSNASGGTSGGDPNEPAPPKDPAPWPPRKGAVMAAPAAWPPEQEGVPAPDLCPRTFPNKLDVYVLCDYYRL